MQNPDNKPGNYYVTVINEKGEYRPLLGPFPNDHQKALDLVDQVRRKALEMDAHAVWYAFGTTRLPEDFITPGILNPYIDF